MTATAVQASAPMAVTEMVKMMLKVETESEAREALRGIETETEVVDAEMAPETETGETEIETVDEEIVTVMTLAETGHDETNTEDLVEEGEMTARKSLYPVARLIY